MRLHVALPDVAMCALTCFLLLQVYVAAAKRSILSCLDLPADQAALLTTNHLEANIHAVPMHQVTLEAMESLLLRYKGRYTAVVGFKPTGWSHAGGSGRNGQKAAAAAPAPAAAAPLSAPSRSSLSIKPNRRRSQRGTVVLYQVGGAVLCGLLEADKVCMWACWHVARLKVRVFAGL